MSDQNEKRRRAHTSDKCAKICTAKKGKKTKHKMEVEAKTQALFLSCVCVYVLIATCKYRQNPKMKTSECPCRSTDETIVRGSELLVRMKCLICEEIGRHALFSRFDIVWRSNLIRQ